VYLFSPSARLTDAVPAAPKLATFSERYKSTHLRCDLPSHVDHGIIGLMDPAHGPFVHQSWFWRSKHSIHEKAKQFEPIPKGFRMSTHSPSTNSAPYQLLKKMTARQSRRRSILYCRICGRKRFAAEAVVFEFDDGDACAARFEPDRFCGCLECAVAGGDFRMFAKTFLRQDQEDDDPAGEGLKHNPRFDVNR